MATSCDSDLSSAKPRRYRHTQTKWESRRERIIQLYVEEGKTADEVVETLKSGFSFSTGRRQLYKKLDEWGVRKNNKLNNEDANTSLSDARHDIVQAVSSAPLVQLSGTATTQWTPAASRTVQSLTSPSAFAEVDSSHAREPPQPDSVALIANTFGASGNLSDNGILPLRPVGRSSFSNHCLTTVSGTEPAGLSSYYLPLAEGWTELRLSQEETLIPARNLSDWHSDIVLCLEQSLCQVLDIISGKIGHIGHSSAMQLKKSVETLFLLSQMIVEKPKSGPSGFQYHHYQSLGKSLNLANSLVALSTSFNLNTYTSVGVPHQMVPSQVVWKRRSTAVHLGSTILNVTEKTTRAFADGDDQDTEDQTADWHLGMKLIFRPEKLSNMLQIQVQQYQTFFGNLSLPPIVVVNNIVRNDSLVFQVARGGSVQELQCLFATGEANLRDCNENGASLLYYASLGWNAPVCEYLIENGFDVDEVILVDSNGGEATPLYLSLRENNLATSKVLLTKNADPTMEFTIRGCRATVLDEAANNMSSPNRDIPDYEIVRYLFQHASHFGVSNYRIHGYRPILHNLCNAGNTPAWLPTSPEEWVENFIEQGCRLEDRCSIGTCLHMFFRSLIHRPSEIGWQKALIRLVDGGANVYAVDDWGKSVSEIAYATLVCAELTNNDLGSYRGDLWDSVLLACNYNIADFRGMCRRTARYTYNYTRGDFEKLWEGREPSCPYWDDSAWPTSSQYHNLEDPYVVNGMVLCTCKDEEPTCWLNMNDTNTTCPNTREHQYLNRHA
ncbi:hypothetical protein F4678DRAFT_467066 [Xylaria arbuscula]|nr:hypothetical protein F4678DRAFT_467066 [Xylaria arbuscula]